MPTETAGPRVPRWTVVLIAVILFVAVAAIGTAAFFAGRASLPAAAVSTPSPTLGVDLEAAEKIRAVIADPVGARCTPFLDDVVDVAPSGESVVLVSHGFGLVSCVLEATGAPDSVYARMEGTRGIDGTQQAEWDFVKAYWTYDGLGESLRVTLEYVAP